MLITLLTKSCITQEVWSIFCVLLTSVVWESFLPSLWANLALLVKSISWPLYWSMKYVGEVLKNKNSSQPGKTSPQRQKRKQSLLLSNIKSERDMVTGSPLTGLQRQNSHRARWVTLVRSGGVCDVQSDDTSGPSLFLPWWLYFRRVALSSDGC